MKIQRHYVRLLNTYDYDEFQQTIIIDDAHILGWTLNFCPSPATLPFRFKHLVSKPNTNTTQQIEKGREKMCVEMNEIKMHFF